MLGLGLTGCESSDSHLGDGYDFGPNDANLYVAFGDSITYGSGVEANQAWPVVLSGLMSKPVITDAIPGSETGDGVDRIHSTLDRRQPGFLLILYGVNDVIMGRGDDARANLQYIVQACIDNKTIPVLATYPPAYGSHAPFNSGIDRLNNDIRSLASTMNVTLVDLYQPFIDGGGSALMNMPDGLHPNALGHQLIAQQFYDKVN